MSLKIFQIRVNFAIKKKEPNQNKYYAIFKLFRYVLNTKKIKKPKKKKSNRKQYYTLIRLKHISDVGIVQEQIKREQEVP